jgi:hypothetical protein
MVNSMEVEIFLENGVVLLVIYLKDVVHDIPYQLNSNL